MNKDKINSWLSNIGAIFCLKVIVVVVLLCTFALLDCFGVGLF